jgi:hypothetical protein
LEVRITKRVISMKTNAELLAVFILKGKGREREGRGGAALNHTCHMIHAKQKPINRLS